jgi:membrane protease YdiL (CAAX protease family)
LAVYGAYRWSVLRVANHVDVMAQITYPVAVDYGPWAILMLLLFSAHRRRGPSGMRFVGGIRAREVALRIALIYLIYLAAYRTTFLLGLPREVTMEFLYAFRSPAQNAILVACLLVLPPLVEELAVRHLLLSAFPYRGTASLPLPCRHFYVLRL